MKIRNLLSQILSLFFIWLSSIQCANNQLDNGTELHHGLNGKLSSIDLKVDQLLEQIYQCERRQAEMERREHQEVAKEIKADLKKILEILKSQKIRNE